VQSCALAFDLQVDEEGAGAGDFEEVGAAAAKAKAVPQQHPRSAYGFFSEAGIEHLSLAFVLKHVKQVEHPCCLAQSLQALLCVFSHSLSHFLMDDDEQLLHSVLHVVHCSLVLSLSVVFDSFPRVSNTSKQYFPAAFLLHIKAIMSSCCFACSGVMLLPPSRRRPPLFESDEAHFGSLMAGIILSVADIRGTKQGSLHMVDGLLVSTLPPRSLLILGGEGLIMLFIIGDF